MSDSAKAENFKGVVKWFNDAKGFGFIEHSSGRDVFVHYSSIESEGFKTLKDGEEVEYEMKEGTKGLHAVKVPQAEEASQAEAASTEAANTETNGSAGISAAVEVSTEAGSGDHNGVGQTPPPPASDSAGSHSGNLSIN